MSQTPGNHSGFEGGMNALPHLDAEGRPTLRTVAELADVHPSTASRALAPQHPGVRVASASTIARVREVAERIGFERNPWAVNLRLRRNDTLGVLVPRLTDIVLATIYEGIEQAADARGVLTLVTNTGDDEQDRLRRAESLLKRRVDGLILGDARFPNDELLASLDQRGIPFVLVSRRSGNYTSVTCDDVAGGALAAQHLIAQGHRDLAVIAGEPYASTGIDRTRGFVDALSEADIPLPNTRILHSGFDAVAGHHAATKLLSSDPRPTAIFAVNDFAAIGAMGAIRDAGLILGNDVALVGYNDVYLARELPIPLTSVRSPHEKMGVRAVELLLNRINGHEIRSETLCPTLHIRESSSKRFTDPG